MRKAIGWLLLGSSCCAAGEVTLPPGSRVLDDTLLYYGSPRATLSPDKRWVAYESRGAAWVADVAGDNPPRRVGELPDTWSEFLARPENAHAEGDFNKLVRGLDRDAYRELVGKVTAVVSEFHWLRDSRAVVWSNRRKDPKWIDYWIANPEGETKKLARITLDGQRVRAAGSHLTNDGRFLVALTKYFSQRPLIWGVGRNLPVATPFLFLAPSPTSDHWIGIEKDSRQLVITDADFQVVQRFEEWMPAQTNGFDMRWSADERYVLWRNQVGFDYHSNWEGARLDLRTGEKRPLEGWYFRERVAFTGRGGEVYRFGADGKRNPRISGNVMTDVHLTLHFGKTGKTNVVWKREFGPEGDVGSYGTLAPSRGGVIIDSKAERFVFAASQSIDEVPRWRWRLMDRAGKAWPLPFDDDHLSERSLPYEIVGFAQGDRVLVGHNGKRLFTLPVDVIVKGPGQVGR